MKGVGSVAVVYGTPAGVGGLGVQAANAIADWARVAERVVAIGPGRVAGVDPPGRVEWVSVDVRVSPAAAHRSWLRWLAGRRQWLGDLRTGEAAAGVLADCRPDMVYTFTQVGRESLAWAATTGVPSVVESPNGHIKRFREVYVREAARHGGWAYLGHPTPRMVARVEEEYALARFVRVSSEWARESLIRGGVTADKVMVIGQRPTAPSALVAFSPRTPARGPLRVCFVGTLDLRKGFVYLLRAARRFGPDRVVVRLVGGTVDRFTRRLLAVERRGLAVEITPGDPVPHLRWAELFALPTLEDGSPFALVEAVAAGLPAVVTSECGNHPLVIPGQTGWVVPAADEGALAGVLQSAWDRRGELPAMGAAARAGWERAAATTNDESLCELASRAEAGA